MDDGLALGNIWREMKPVVNTSIGGRLDEKLQKFEVLGQKAGGFLKHTWCSVSIGK